jgi:hypothetical protein
MIGVDRRIVSGILARLHLVSQLAYVRLCDAGRVGRDANVGWL